MSEKKCPFCSEMINSEAIKCKHCQSDLIVKAEIPAPVDGGKLHTAWYVAAVLIPIVGLVASIVGFAKHKTNAMSLLATSIGAFAFWLIVGSM